MPDADPQAPILLRRQMRRNVLQAVVTTAAATELQLHRTGRQIEFIVRNKDFIRQDLEELCNGHHRLTRSIHEGLWLEQMNLLTVEPAASVVTVKPAFITQRCTRVARQLIDEPEAGVVTCRGVFGARIAETDDQFDHVQSWRRSGLWLLPAQQHRTHQPHQKKAKKNPPEQSNGGSLFPRFLAGPHGLERTSCSPTY